MQSRYVCVFTVSVWSDKQTESHRQARKLMEDIAGQCTDGLDCDLLVSDVTGPILCSYLGQDYD